MHDELLVLPYMAMCFAAWWLSPLPRVVLDHEQLSLLQRNLMQGHAYEEHTKPLALPYGHVLRCLGRHHHAVDELDRCVLPAIGIPCAVCAMSE